MWTQSTTQLHANIQLDSLVTSWPSSYFLYHAAYNHIHPQKVWTGCMGEPKILSRESPLALAGLRPPGVCGYVLFNLWWKPCVLYQLVPDSPFYLLFEVWVSREIEVAVVTGGSIMVRRHRGDTTPCAESLPLPTHHGEGNVLKQKMAYTTHLPPCSPILYLPCYVRNAPCGTRISLYTCHWIHNKVCLVPVPKLEPHSRTLLYTTTKVTFFTVLRP
jgi:hypothetical protein